MERTQGCTTQVLVHTHRVRNIFPIHLFPNVYGIVCKMVYNYQLLSTQTKKNVCLTVKIYIFVCFALFCFSSESQGFKFRKKASIPHDWLCFKDVNKICQGPVDTILSHSGDEFTFRSEAATLVMTNFPWHQWKRRYECVCQQTSPKQKGIRISCWRPEWQVMSSISQPQTTSLSTSQKTGSVNKSSGVNFSYGVRHFSVDAKSKQSLEVNKLSSKCKNGFMTWACRHTFYGIFYHIITQFLILSIPSNLQNQISKRLPVGYVPMFQHSHHSLPPQSCHFSHFCSHPLFVVYKR